MRILIEVWYFLKEMLIPVIFVIGVLCFAYLLAYVIASGVKAA